VLLCDYYYFLYSIATAAGIGAYLWRKRRARPSNALSLFTVSAIVVCTPLALGLLLSDLRDQLRGAHNARTFSNDLVGGFLTGGLWRFSPITAWYWVHFKSYFLSGNTVYLGVAVLVALVVAAIGRRRVHRDASLWLVIAGVFWVFSLRPRLMVLGRTREAVPLPYAVLERVVPPLRLGGTPVRMVVIVTLAAGVVTAMVLAHLDLRRPRHAAVFALFCAVLILEMWPTRLPSTRATHPRYVDALSLLPGNGALYDAAAPGQGSQLYYQTIHQKRLALGYISRTPKSVLRQDEHIQEDVAANRYDLLCD
jgi:hypothetical protein